MTILWLVTSLTLTCAYFSLQMENNRVTFIPCAKWVKKGVARHNPEKVCIVLFIKRNELFYIDIVGTIKQRRTSSHNKPDKE